MAPEQGAYLAASGQTAGAARTLGALSARLPSSWATGASWGEPSFVQRPAPTALWWPLKAEPLGGREDGKMMPLRAEPAQDAERAVDSWRDRVLPSGTFWPRGSRSV